MLDLTTLSIVFNVLSAAIDGLQSVMVEYLTTSCGITWMLTLYIQYYLGTLLMTLSWILWFFFEYYYGCVEQGLGEVNNHTSFTSYLLSIFPSINENDKQKWFVLIFRSLCGVLSLLNYDIALSYSNAGDVLLIEFVTTMLISILFGWIFFKEKYNVIVLMCLISCLGGGILVIQPTLIFGTGREIETMNFYGFIFIFISGVIRGIAQALIKHSFVIKVHWISIILIPQLLGCIVLLFIFIIGSLLLDWSLISDDIFDNNNNNNNYVLLLLCGTGLMYYLFYTLCTLSFRIGNIGRLGIIQNSNIVFGYLFSTILGVEINYICTIGIILVLTAFVVMFFEMKTYDDDNGNDNDNASNHDDQIQYQQVRSQVSEMD